MHDTRQGVVGPSGIRAYNRGDELVGTAACTVHVASEGESLLLLGIAHVIILTSRAANGAAIHIDLRREVDVAVLAGAVHRAIHFGAGLT